MSIENGGTVTSGRRWRPAPNHLVDEGLGRREGQRVVFNRDCSPPADSANLTLSVRGSPVKEAAERLSMSCAALSRVLNGKAGISPGLVVRLEMAGASTARFWINLQANYDLWQAQQHGQGRPALECNALLHYISGQPVRKVLP